MDSGTQLSFSNSADDVEVVNMTILTLNQFYKLCPNMIKKPVNVEIGGSLLWKEEIDDNSDLDIAIWSPESHYPNKQSGGEYEIIVELQKLIPNFKISAFFGEAYGTCHTPLYINGKKVEKCPTCPPHTPSLKERLWLLEQRVAALEAAKP